MASRKLPALAILPTAILFGLGIGNLWGIAGLFTQLGNPQWVWAIQISCLIVLTAFLCGVARAWWPRGAAVPLFMTIAAAWAFSAPAAVVTGRFTLIAWAVWLIALAICGVIAFAVAWLFERRT